MKQQIESDAHMQEFGVRLGGLLQGGEVIELVGDVGAGKTTLVKGLARGLAIDDTVQSPTFTINRVYTARDELELVHYDFYRLIDAGIMTLEVAERVNDPRSIVVVEWAEVVDTVLPDDRLTVHITSPTETTREITLRAGGERSEAMAKELV